MILIHRGCNGHIEDLSPLMNISVLYAMFNGVYQWLQVYTPLHCTRCNGLIVGDDTIATVVKGEYTNA